MCTNLTGSPPFYNAFKAQADHPPPMFCLLSEDPKKDPKQYAKENIKSTPFLFVTFYEISSVSGRDEYYSRDVSSALPVYLLLSSMVRKLILRAVE